MNSDLILKEKLDNLNGEIEDLKREKNEILLKLRETNAKKTELCNFISRCAIFDDTILFLIAKLLTERCHEPFRVFEYKKYREVCVYPRLLDESTYIGIASEDNIKCFIKNGNYNIDRFFKNDLGYEIYQKDGRIIEPNKDCYDKITGIYNLDDLHDKRRPITFSFLLDQYEITNTYCGRVVRTNFLEYPYVQDFITYIFNIQIKKGGSILTYKEMCKAYDDFLPPEKVLEKTKSK